MLWHVGSGYARHLYVVWHQYQLATQEEQSSKFKYEAGQLDGIEITTVQLLFKLFDIQYYPLWHQ
jgi:hypothetical protein